MKNTQSSKDGRTTVSIAAYDAAQSSAEASICRRLRAEIERALPGAASKVWHGAPVWFVGDTPVVGYSVPAGGGVALLFWNGQAFGDPALKPAGKFKAAEIRFETASEIKATALRRWLRKAGTELWDVSSVRRNKGSMREPGGSKTVSTIRFSAKLSSPRLPTGKPASWTFLNLPRQASAKLPSRGQTTVEGTLNRLAFRATLEPDGQGGHWLKVDRKLREAAGAEVGDVVALDIAPIAADREPEPKVPADLRKALAAAPPGARGVWSDITPIARRDWIHWIVSAKQAETRARRITTACDMLAKGKRRPCCFDRSGMFDKSLSCPVADDTPSGTRRSRP